MWHFWAPSWLCGVFCLLPSFGLAEKHTKKRRVQLGVAPLGSVDFRLLCAVLSFDWLSVPAEAVVYAQLACGTKASAVMSVSLCVNLHNIVSKLFHVNVYIAVSTVSKLFHVDVYIALLVLLVLVTLVSKFFHVNYIALL